MNVESDSNPIRPRSTSPVKGRPPRPNSMNKLDDIGKHRRSHSHTEFVTFSKSHTSLAAPNVLGGSLNASPILDSLPSIRPKTPVEMERSQSELQKRQSWWGSRKLSSDNASSLVLGESNHKEIDFRTMFGFPPTENFVASFGAYLVKILPHLGKVYLSTNHISFKSKLVGSRAKAIIPINRISKVEMAKGYIHFGLTVTTKDQEDILFEFHNSESQHKCFEYIDSVMQAPRPFVSSKTLLQDAIHQDTHLKNAFEIDTEHITIESQPVRCPPPMRITMITIGTRGDVQPYIALCKGFMADGHHCTLATHLEFKEWIEGFGIIFKEIKGNPAELMQLCVDYGMFTVGFIYNAMSNVLI